MTALVFGLVLAALLLAAVTVALSALLVREERRARRKTARAAERAARPRGPVDGLDSWTEPWRWWCCERGFLTRDAWHNHRCAKYDPSKESC
ncbi:hypothetical protein ACFVUB_11160 [Streptomyces niveus]|uniref:hypothetical protein n=1 Tax=Streptomyces niveus TaxID=193462 RepID=UPI0036D9B662